MYVNPQHLIDEARAYEEANDRGEAQDLERPHALMRALWRALETERRASETYDRNIEAAHHKTEIVHRDGLSTAAELGLSLIVAKEERDAAIASAAALREALSAAADALRLVRVRTAEENTEDYCGDHEKRARAALADNAGAALLERLHAAEAQAAEFGADASRLQGENGRLAAQLLQDGPIAAAARVWAKAHEDWGGAHGGTLEDQAAERRKDEAEDALYDLAREQKGGA